jgi:hypothetical protein
VVKTDRGVGSSGDPQSRSRVTERGLARWGRETIGRSKMTAQVRGRPRATGARLAAEVVLCSGKVRVREDCRRRYRIHSGDGGQVLCGGDVGRREETVQVDLS